MIRAVLKRAWTLLRDLLRECRSQEAVALLAVTLVLITRHALAAPAGRSLLAPLWDAIGRGRPLLGDAVFQSQLTAIALQLLVPLSLIYGVHRGRARDFGLGLGEPRFWVPLTAIIFAAQVLVIGGWLHADPTYATRYPTLTAARQGGAIFWAWEASRVGYLLSWELLFRGYLLFALARRLGLLACVVQMMPFALTHIAGAKPISEIYFTLVSGLLSGVFAWGSRSVWPLVWLHAAGAVLLDVWIVHG